MLNQTRAQREVYRSRAWDRLVESTLILFITIITTSWLSTVCQIRNTFREIRLIFRNNLLIKMFLSSRLKKPPRVTHTHKPSLQKKPSYLYKLCNSYETRWSVETLDNPKLDSLHSQPASWSAPVRQQKINPSDFWGRTYWEVFRSSIWKGSSDIKLKFSFWEPLHRPRAH